MAQTGTEILSYVGDKNLGLGANADIPAINPAANLNIINQTARDILLLNHENNIRLYQQKINDRDQTLKLLADGQVSSGDIDPNDRVYYDRAKKDAKDAFYKMIQNGGLNNSTAVKEYQDKVGDLYNVAVHAQGRQLEWKKLEQEKANQVLPDDISMYDNHIKSERGKDFWQPINPIQKAFDLNLPQMTSSIAGTVQTQGQAGQLDEQGLPMATTQWNTTTDKNGVITNKQTTKTAPLRSAQITSKQKGVVTGGTVVQPDGTLSEITYTPEKYWDYDTMLKNAQEQYVSDPTQRQNQIEWLKNVTQYDDAQKLKLLQAYNNRIEDYSKERGIQSDKINTDGSLHYPDQINFGADPTGKIQIQENPSSFAAKHTLASIEGNYVEKPKAIFDKDIAKHNVDLAELALKGARTKADIAALKALENERYSKSNLNYKKSRAVDSQFNPKQVFDELFTGKMNTVHTKAGNYVTRVNSNDLSKGLQDVLGIEPLNSKGDYNLVPANIKFKDKQIDENLIWKGYPNWLKSEQANKIQEANGKIPSVFDYIYSQGGDFEVEVEGKTKKVYNQKTKMNEGGGKFIRSNRLQSYINQMNQGGVKGKELIKLLSGDDIETEPVIEETNITKESGNANDRTE